MLGLGHDVVDVPAFAEQLGEPGSRMRNLFSMRELWQTAQRVQVKRDGEAVHLAARWAGKEAFLKAWCEAISRRANADGLGNAEGGWKCGSKLMENKFPEKVSAAIAIATLLIV